MNTALENIDVDTVLMAKTKNDKLLVEIIKYQQEQIKELKALLCYEQNDDGVSPAGLIAPRNAAIYLGMSERTVRESAKQGYFHEVPFLGQIYYVKKEIDEYIKSCLHSKLKKMV